MLSGVLSTPRAIEVEVFVEREESLRSLRLGVRLVPDA
jgi:hypothetical protein